MQKYEYDVIILERKPGEADQVYRWRCCKHGSCHEPHELEAFLNHMGQEGWHVAAFSSDGRFGSSIVLQRRVQEGAQPSAGPAMHATASPGPAVMMASPVTEALLAEVKALREQVADQALTTEPMTAALRLQMQQREAAAAQAQAATAQAMEAMSVALRQLPEQLREVTAAPAVPTQVLAPEPQPAYVVMGPETLRTFETMLQRITLQASVAPVTAQLDPAAMQLMEQVLARGTRDDDHDDPGGPAVAVLDPASLAELQRAQREFNERVLAEMSRPAAPVQVQATATLAEGAEVRLRAALMSALRQSPAPLAELTPESVERLGVTIERALLAMTRPEPAAPVVVEVPSDLSPATVSALRSALVEAVRSVAAPVVEVAPVVQATLDEAAVAKLAPPRSVSLAPEALTGLEVAVSRAVAHALRQHQVEQAQEQPVEEVRKRSWWPWAPSKLSMAFGR